jgi:hypothetical protein
METSNEKPIWLISDRLFLVCANFVLILCYLFLHSISVRSQAADDRAKTFGSIITMCPALL